MVLKQKVVEPETVICCNDGQVMNSAEGYLSLPSFIFDNVNDTQTHQSTSDI